MSTSDGQSRELKRLATIDRRGGEEQIRVSLDEFTPDRGEAHRYISVRLWFKDDENRWRPTKRGVTVRASEVADVVQALRQAESILGQ